LKGSHKLFETPFEMFLFKEKSNLLRVFKTLKRVLKLQNYIFPKKIKSSKFGRYNQLGTPINTGFPTDTGTRTKSLTFLVPGAFMSHAISHVKYMQCGT